MTQDKDPNTGQRPAICVFCGSRNGSEPVYLDAAHEVGRRCADKSYRLIYGGGNVGLMRAVSEGALSARGKVTGVIPEKLLSREAGKREVDDFVVTRTMAERKEVMISRASAFVVLPGGYGTLDELLEVITLKQLGYHAKPIQLLDLLGFWQPCLEFLKTMTDLGLAEPPIATLVETSASVDELFSALSEALAV